MSARRAYFVSTLALMLLACGRDGHADPKASIQPEAALAQPAAAGVVPAATPAQDDQYSVRVDAVTLRAGAAGSAVVTIAPGKGLKFNEEYPAKFRVEATSFVKGAKEKLSAKEGDVKVVDKQGVVTVPLQGLGVGSGPVKLVGSFSVCSAEQCFILRDQSLSIPVSVR